MPEPRGANFPATSFLVYSAGRQPGSVARARHFVSEHINESLEDIRENAELVTSELVTNVLVHTDSPATLRVLVASDSLRVEVYDDCAVVPVGGILDPTAACGRGLVLVERLSHRWGVTRVPGAGKCVWFELYAGVPTAGDDLTADDVLDMWADEDDMALPAFDLLPAGVLEIEAGADEPIEAEPTKSIRIPDVPTHLLNSTRSHLDDLVRDLTLITESAASGEAQDDDLLSLGCRLCGLVLQLGDFRNEIRRQGLDAAHRHDETMTLEIDLRPSQREPLMAYRQALDEADEFSAEGRLLIPPPPPDHVEFRRWKLGRIIDQLGGKVIPTT